MLDAAKELEKLGKREADAAAKVSPLHSSSGLFVHVQRKGSAELGVFVLHRKGLPVAHTRRASACHRAPPSQPPLLPPSLFCSQVEQLQKKLAMPSYQEKTPEEIKAAGALRCTLRCARRHACMVLLGGWHGMCISGRRCLGGMLWACEHSCTQLQSLPTHPHHTPF